MRTESIHGLKARRVRMADLFLNQAKAFVENRPTYPTDLFRFIASKCPRRHLVWDVGTGNGQAAIPLAGIFDEVVATDTSPTQLAHATGLPNIRYVHTPPDLPSSALIDSVSTPSTVDLITVAQAIHWLDHRTFYAQAHTLLRKPGGVLAAWCYTVPRVSLRVDQVYDRIYKASAEHWAPERRLVDEELRTISFPFEPVEGEVHTGPFEFEAQREMGLEGFLGYVRSWSAYETAKGRGVELLPEEVVEEFREAWGREDQVKVVKFPVFLRLGALTNDPWIL